MNTATLLSTLAKNKKLLGGLGLAVLALLGAYLVFRPAPMQVETARVKQTARFEETVDEDGVTRVIEKFTLYAPVSGVLERVAIHAGDPVRKQQSVATVLWDRRQAVLSPIAGRVLRVIRESAGPIQMGEPILEVGDTERLEVVAEILTADAIRVRPTQNAYIENWSETQQRIPARVRLVEPQAFAKVSALGVEEQRVRVILTPLPPAGVTGPGDAFRVRCRIVVFEKSDGLVVPTGALFRDGEDWAVFRVVQKRARKTAVRITRRNATEALIESGLAVGDEVVLYPGDMIAEGARVREQAP